MGPSAWPGRVSRPFAVKVIGLIGRGTRPDLHPGQTDALRRLAFHVLSPEAASFGCLERTDKIEKFG